MDMEGEGDDRVGKVGGARISGKAQIGAFRTKKVKGIRDWIELAVIVCSRQCEMRMEVGDNRLQRVEVLKFEPQKLALPLWVLP